LIDQPYQFTDFLQVECQLLAISQLHSHKLLEKLIL
jgi:hypothetical protein